ncbi:cysteine protease ATG4B [Aplysia californica]|uniref:Cysteine protease n=1 Tax=Aplysia californica TaxID=6500 RepID=A0ABM1W2D0_APLCA|nr:cysteine protease ATG4B [Aplysia californica]
MDFDVSVGTFTYESGPGEYEDFPRTEEPVFILGEVYSAEYDREELKDDIKSRIWVTYRRNFQNIGGMGPSSDQGWGCMLRCGQMMLAQALVLRHLGRSWRWDPLRTDETYWKLLRMFEDKKTSTYSIHQIAAMGEAEGKSVGQWFGPNTIAQVLKRICVYDNWSDIAIHVALDNVVVIDEIRNLCKSPRPQMMNGDSVDLPEGAIFSQFVNDVPRSGGPSSTASSGQGRAGHQQASLSWRPLLLMIPLRLGLTEINPIYFDALKKCFTLPQSVGIIGGKPNHAHWFIGYFGKELIYLDPHTTQPVVDLEDRSQTDSSYHCCTPPSRMGFHKLDPSIALGFYCGTEKDFEDLCDSFSTYDRACRSMFEVRKDIPPAWKRDQPTSSDGATGGRYRNVSLSDFTLVPSSPAGEGSSVDDEEFEII